MTLAEAMRDMVDSAFRVQQRDYLTYYLLEAQYNALLKELMKRESPLHTVAYMDEDGLLWMCGLRVEKLQSVPGGYSAQWEE